MNLLLYFCVPLVVTGQLALDRPQTENRKQNDVDNQVTSATGLYSKHEYGSHVGYNVSPVDEFAVDQQGEYYRKPSIVDSGAVGIPSVYNTPAGGGNDDHPSFIASNIYNSLKDKKNNNSGRNNNNEVTSPQLAYGAPANINHQNVITETFQPNLAPVAQQVHLYPVANGHPVILQDPQTGQLVPVYQSQLTPHHSAYGVPQNGVHDDYHAHQQHHVLGKTPVYQAPLVKTPVSPLYQTPFVKTPAVSLYEAHAHHKLKSTGEPILYQAPFLKTPVAPVYSHQLFKTFGGPVYQAPVAPLYQHQQYLHKPEEATYQVPILQNPHLQQSILRSALYHQAVHHHPNAAPLLFKSADGTVYQAPAPYINTAANPLLIKSPIYHTPEGLPLVHTNPHAPVLSNDVSVPLHKQPTLNDATAHALLKGTQGVFPQQLLKTGAGPLSLAPLLKSGVEATIVPAIEEHVHELQPPLSHGPFIAKAPFHPVSQLLLSPKYPSAVFQKAILHKTPALIEKAVIKEALSPVYTNSVHGYHNDIVKAPLHAHYAQNGYKNTNSAHGYHHHHKAIVKAPLLAHYAQNGYLEPDLPAKILSSHKPLVNSLISSGKYRDEKATSVELVPSLSYGYSYSLFPNSNGLYSSPTHPHSHK